MFDPTTRVRGAVGRVVFAATVLAALVTLYILEPTSASISPSEEIRSLAAPIAEAIDLTLVLAATVVLAIVAMVRHLPYGVAAVLIVSIGANLTSGLAGSWLPNTPLDLLPNGHIVAAVALYGSALLVCAPRFQPALIGLGFTSVVAITAAAVVAEPTSIYGALASIGVGLMWWALGSALMQFSPIAAERESRRADTAAIALSRDLHFTA
ncbi:MAG: hypothetical protein GX542_10650 [Rhodococcus sp.]|nr:hypothetical protein [Rhodococcus sp. (in: high G+C Gram-positive bacteria)]